MTEIEIMKSAEYCKSGDCVSCPLSSNRYESKCKTILFEAVIDLINRKNVYLAECGKILNKRLDELSEKNAEIEKLCGEVDELIIAKDQLFDEAEELIKKARAEAIKEVLEKVKEKTAYLFSAVSIKYEIDQIAKEMGVEL